METNAQGPRRLHRPLSRDRFGLLHIEKKLSTIIVVARASLGQRKPSRRAIEKREPEFSLKRRDQLAQDRGRHIERVGGRRERLRLDGTAKKLDGA